MSQPTTLFAFFAHANTDKFGIVIDSSPMESWIQNIREVTQIPDAEVVLISEEEWDAPKLTLTTFDDEEALDAEVLNTAPAAILPGINRALTSRGVPAMSRDELTGVMGWIPNPRTGLLVFIIRYDHPAPAAKKKESFLSNLFGRKKQETKIRISQQMLANFMASMKAAGAPLEGKMLEAAAMLAIKGLGHDVAKNAHILREKTYEVSMEGNDVIVSFPPQVEFR